MGAVSEPLRGLVRTVRIVAADLSPGRERLIPRGTVVLTVNLAADELRVYDSLDGAGVTRRRGAVVAGPQRAARVIDREDQRHLLHVAFEPGAAAAFIPMPISELADASVELGELWGAAGASLRERILEQPSDAERCALVERFLLERLDPSRVPRVVAPAAAAFARGARIAATAERLGVSERGLLRSFREAVGLPPKRYARIRRFQRLLGALAADGERDWARLAFAHGFADQAHLAREFRDLAGITPTAYHPRSAAPVA